MEYRDAIPVRSNGVFHAAGLDELEKRNESARPGLRVADPQEEIANAKAEILTFLLHHCWDIKSDRLPLARRLDIAFRRFLVLSWQVDADLLDSHSLAAIGAILDISRAALSKIACDNSDQLGIVGGGQKRLSAREGYRLISQEGWEKRRENHGETGMGKDDDVSTPDIRRKAKKSPKGLEDAILKAAEMAEHARKSAVRSEAAADRSTEAADRAWQAVEKIEG